jgi:TPR repeat protein
VLALPGCEPAAYTDVAAAMQRAGRHDDALLLLELAAERGHVPAMTALAKLYDPATFRAGQPFSAPDPRQAARLYRDAAQGGDAAAAPLREALRTTLQAAAEGGDQIARLTLQDYWP